MQIIQTIKNDFHSIPTSVKWVTLMFSLWIFGWGFADPMFSLYLKNIVPDYALIGILASITSLISVLLAIPLGETEDHFDPIVFFGWWLLGYVLLGAMYWFAGVHELMNVLIAALILNGIVNSLVNVSARTYIKKKSSVQKASTFVGLFNMCIFLFYALGMFLGFYGNKIYNLNTVFLVTSFTSLLAYLWIRSFFNKQIKESKKQNFFTKFCQLLKKQHALTQVISDLKTYEKNFYYALTLIFFVWFVDTMVIIFIPLLAMELNLHLGQISLLMGIMYLPYLFSFVFAEIADRYERIAVSTAGLLLSSITMFFLYATTSNILIAVLSALLALSLALINPAAEGMITALTPMNKRGEMTGVQSVCNRSGRFLWPLTLGFIAKGQWIHFVFLVVALVSIFLAILSIFIKLKMRNFKY